METFFFCMRTHLDASVPGEEYITPCWKNDLAQLLSFQRNCLFSRRGGAWRRPDAGRDAGAPGEDSWSAFPTIQVRVKRPHWERGRPRPPMGVDFQQRISRYPTDRVRSELISAGA